MKKFWKKYRVWLIVLAVVAVLVAVSQMSKAVDPHAGHNHDTDPHTEQNQSAGSHDGHDHSGYKAENSYTINTDQNGHYTVTVKDAHGETIFSRGNLVNKPVCTTVNDQVLMVSQTAGADYGSHWAVFCNVQTNKISSVFNGCLYARDTYVAYVTTENNNFTVNVQDAFNKATYNRSYVLEGAAAADGRPVISKVTPTQDGSLSITYWAGATEKSITVPVVPKK